MAFWPIPFLLLFFFLQTIKISEIFPTTNKTKHINISYLYYFFEKILVLQLTYNQELIFKVNFSNC